MPEWNPDPRDPALDPTSAESTAENPSSPPTVSVSGTAAPPTAAAAPSDATYREAMASVERTLERLNKCSEAEKSRLKRDWDQLRQMSDKLQAGSVEIAVFGEISTGKSAMINALVGEAVAEVNVQGGWTKEVWQVPWDGCGYCVPGFAQSQVVLIDTPGLNEVGGQLRGEMAHEAAERADLILFVTDSDLNETEYSALLELARVQKPMILVLNKRDLFSREQLSQLRSVLKSRVGDVIPESQIIATAADPREIEFVIQAADGSTQQQWRKPDPDVEELKIRILEVLEKEGLAIIALNAAMYAADKSDRIAALRVQMRDTRANQTIASYAVVKSVAVALNPAAVTDILGGSAVDITMVVTLAHLYGLEMNWVHARRLIVSIAKAAGWVMALEWATGLAASAFKALTVGYGTVVTAVPQGAAAGYGSYIVGKAAKYYFEHGASWGGESPKVVVRRILESTDKESVLNHLRDEIRRRLDKNPHATS